jgi:hypothetical protein
MSSPPPQIPPIPPLAVILRVVSILGMGLTFSGCVLALVAAEWWWAIGTGIAFVPFMLMMGIVDRLIPDVSEWVAENTPSNDQD